MVQTTGKQNPVQLARKQRERVTNKLSLKYITKPIITMKLDELAEIVEVLAIRAGVADDKGNVIG